jgi:hypothetical protein
MYFTLVKNVWRSNDHLPNPLLMRIGHAIDSTKSTEYMLLSKVIVKSIAAFISISASEN